MLGPACSPGEPAGGLGGATRPITEIDVSKEAASFIASVPVSIPDYAVAAWIEAEGDHAPEFAIINAGDSEEFFRIYCLFDLVPRSCSEGFSELVRVPGRSAWRAKSPSRRQGERLDLLVLEEQHPLRPQPFELSASLTPELPPPRLDPPTEGTDSSPIEGCDGVAFLGVSDASEKSIVHEEAISGAGEHWVAAAWCEPVERLMVHVLSATRFESVEVQIAAREADQRPAHYLGRVDLSPFSGELVWAVAIGVRGGALDILSSRGVMVRPP